MNRLFSIAIGIGALTLGAQALQAAQITFYEGEGFRGRAFTARGQVDNFMRAGFNDRASSVVVGSGRWEVCEDNQFRGHCVLLQRGSYDSLRGLGLNDRISSVRLASRGGRYEDAPPPRDTADYEWRRRPAERVYEVPISSAHAIYGPPEQHCWVEREQVVERSGPNVGGAVAGAIIGGILGHQIGGRNSRDATTVGGAVVGGAIGANAGRNSTVVSDRDVQRCEASRSSGPPDYWDVTYNYRGTEHHVQMSGPPGPTILVNRDGMPRQ
jgi:uncharacterized protein YcfJ